MTIYVQLAKKAQKKALQEHALVSYRHWKVISLMTKKRNYPDSLCAYCAKNPATTGKGDHIFPRCLFFPPLPSNLVTIPACRACNEALSKDEDYLRDYLITDFRVENHPTVRELIVGPLQRAVAENKSKLARAAQAHAHSGGNILDVPIDANRIYSMYQMMVRGAYYYLFKERLPSEYVVSVFPADPNDPEAKTKVQRRIKGLGVKQMAKWGEYGDVIAQMERFPDEDVDPGITYCVIIFYLGIYIEAITHPPTLSRDLMYEAVCRLAEQGLH